LRATRRTLRHLEISALPCLAMSQREPHVLNSGAALFDGRRAAFLHLLFSLFFGRLRQFLESGFHMQSHFIALLVLALGAASALAQTGTVAAPGAQPASAASIEAEKRKAHAAAIADCEAMWDRATHMTRMEWSRTCRRVQVRLQQLELR
jgi:hypothetical protein